MASPRAGRALAACCRRARLSGASCSSERGRGGGTTPGEPVRRRGRGPEVRLSRLPAASLPRVPARLLPVAPSPWWRCACAVPLSVLRGQLRDCRRCLSTACFEWSTAAPRRRANVAAIRRPLLTFTASPVTTSCDSRSAYVAELTEHRKAHGLPGFPRLPGVPGDFRGGRPWPQPTGDRNLLWG